jgi:hypothetical protein
VNILFLILSTAGAAESDWTHNHSRLSWLGGHVTHTRSTYRNLPIDGPPEVVFTDTAGATVDAIGARPRHIPANLSPSISAQYAATIAADNWYAPTPSRGTLVLLQDNDTTHLAWRFRIEAAEQIWTTWLDAHSGETLASEADSWSTQGWVYDPNPAVSELSSEQLLGLDENKNLRGHFAFATDCIEWRIDPKPYGERVCVDWEHAAKATADGNFYIEPNHGELYDPFAEVQAYFHADRIARWLNDRFGIYLGYSLQIFTNFPLTNAFFGDFDDDGDRDISFGISDDGFNLAYDSDVVYHEFGHGIVRNLAGSMWMQADTLGNDWTPGALNEGVADTFAMILNPDPLLAESLGASDRWDLAIRDLERDRICPDNLQSQVHRSGEIWGSMAWNLISDPRIGEDLTADLLVGTIAGWGNGTNWTDAGWSLIETAETLFNDQLIDQESLDAITQHVANSGMLDCERIIDLQQTETSQQYLMNLGLDGPYGRIPGGVQFQYQTPAESNEFHINIQDFTGFDAQTGLAVYLRAGSPVEHEATRIEGLGLHHAIPVLYDTVFEINESSATIVLNDNSEPPLIPGERYFWSIATINQGRTPMDVAYSKVTVQAQALIGDITSPAISKSVGCTTRPSQPDNRFIWLITVGVLIITRRSRTP